MNNCHMYLKGLHEMQGQHGPGRILISTASSVQHAVAACGRSLGAAWGAAWGGTFCEAQIHLKATFCVAAWLWRTYTFAVLLLAGASASRADLTELDTGGSDRGAWSGRGVGRGAEHSDDESCKDGMAWRRKCVVTTPAQGSSEPSPPPSPHHPQPPEGACSGLLLRAWQVGRFT